jgi:hypothetical protein
VALLLVTAAWHFARWLWLKPTVFYSICTPRQNIFPQFFAEAAKLQQFFGGIDRKAANWMAIPFDDCLDEPVGLLELLVAFAGETPIVLFYPDSAWQNR